jgi:hypothetical protein
MDLSSLSDKSIVDLHGAIADALTADLAAGGEDHQVVRKYAAWRIHADAYEAEMTARAIDFVAINWGPGDA